MEQEPRENQKENMNFEMQLFKNKESALSAIRYNRLKIENKWSICLLKVKINNNPRFLRG